MISFSSCLSLLVLFSMNASGTMRFWSFDEGSRNTVSSESQYRDWSLPIQTLCLGIECPLNVSFSPNTSQLVVVTKTHWMVIPFSNALSLKLLIH
jgi:hypothetical protein